LDSGSVNLQCGWLRRSPGLTLPGPRLCYTRQNASLSTLRFRLRSSMKGPLSARQGEPAAAGVAVAPAPACCPHSTSAPRQVKWRSWSCDGCWPRGTRNEPGARLGHDPEALHQLRVTARRIDATLGSVQTPAPHGALARAQDRQIRAAHPGAARDLDVQLAELARYCAGCPNTSVPRRSL